MDSAFPTKARKNDILWGKVMKIEVKTVEAITSEDDFNGNAVEVSNKREVER
jgi:hypothetical protein